MKGGIYRVYEPIRSVTDGYLTKFMSAHREFETTAASNSFCFFSFLLFLFFPLSFSLFFFLFSRRFRNGKASDKPTWISHFLVVGVFVFSFYTSS